MSRTNTDKRLEEIFDFEFLVQLEPYMGEDERTHKRRKYIGDGETIKRVKTRLEALINEAVREARIDEVEQFSDWINKGLAETHRVNRLAALNKDNQPKKFLTGAEKRRWEHELNKDKENQKDE